MTAKDTDVFINCPFGIAEYEERLQAIVFTVHHCGYRARCALELDDSGTTRVDKIFGIIRECRLGIHDISYVELDPQSGLPRFNMPLELGFFLGAKRYGSERQQRKIALILDSESYRYQQFCSDIAGQDIKAHGNDNMQVVRCVRNWLRNQSDAPRLPGARRIWTDYLDFQSTLPRIAEQLGLDVEHDELQFNDFTTTVVEWLSSPANA